MILLISCPDQPGIIARFTGILYGAGANILSLEQHVEDEGLFFMRVHADMAGLSLAAAELEGRLRDLAGALGASLSLRDPRRVMNVGILVTSEPSCLADLLAKRASGRLRCRVPLVIGNREALRGIAENHGVPFHHVPLDEGNRAEAEARMTALLEEAGVELVVLARYMKILSEPFVDRFAERIINIHHSFLPAFKGARPYHQAWERGVKMIGATAHFATADLDEGPIIAQDVTPVTHQHTAEAMVELGRDVERRVLGEAVEVFLEHRVIRHHRRTVVFGRR